MKTSWIPTKEMAELLDLHRITLLRIRKTDYLREGFHYVKKNPVSPRGDFVWHPHRTMEKFGRV